MKNRIMTSIAIVLTLVLMFILKILVSDYFFDAFIAIATCFAAFETSRIFTKMGKYNYNFLATIFPLILLALNLIGIHYDKSLGIAYTLLIDIAAILVFFAGAFLFGMITSKKSRNEMKIRNINNRTSLTNYAFNKAFNTGVCFIYPSFLLMLMTILNHLDNFTSSFSGVTKFGGYASLLALLLMFLIPIFTDTFAYITGSLIGGKKLAPSISPKKTISGAIGGSVICVILCTCLYLILNAINPIYIAFADAGFKIWHMIIISLIGSVISQLGDLFESFLKRKAGVKDSGKIFPGHGGMLDRCDSYLFVAPFLLITFVIILAII